ncbi:hypothetical protein, partial [Mycobacterium sp.]|uniref:hypothetical protein n=1 Tax=Mycobacterium sp. TaxID=1785 RepID=UPI003C70E3E1
SCWRRQSARWPTARWPKADELWPPRQSYVARRYRRRAFDQPARESVIALTETAQFCSSKVLTP